MASDDLHSNTVCYLQSGLELTRVVNSHVTFQSSVESRYKPASNWITCVATASDDSMVASDDSMLYIGDSSGQLTRMNFPAVVIDKQKKVHHRLVNFGFLSHHFP